jgi:hypothetical protein
MDCVPLRIFCLSLHNDRHTVNIRVIGPLRPGAAMRRIILPIGDLAKVIVHGTDEVAVHVPPLGLVMVALVLVHKLLG